MPDPSPLRDLLIRSGHNVTSFGRAVGISRDAIHRWLRGDTGPRLDHLGAAADVLGVTVEELERAVEATRRRKPSRDS